MASITFFEDLVAWQKARRLVGRVYALIEEGRTRRDFKLADQLRSAAVSVMSNVAEGFERRNPRDFRRFLLIAKASSAELQSLLYVATDAGYISESELTSLMSEARELSRIIGGLINVVSRHAD